MKVKELQEVLSRIPDNAEVMISNPVTQELDKISWNITAVSRRVVLVLILERSST